MTPPNPAQTILVCGGAGYIGAHMCKALARAGHLPVTFDNLATGHRQAVQWGPLIKGDLLDLPTLHAAFAAHPIDAVMHFAARSQVGESVTNPGLYFSNNVSGTLNLLAAMRHAGVQQLVFSSTAAVYGQPAYTPIDESHPTQPINPYGWSKLMAERIIQEHCRAHGISAAALRYFNAAGADAEGYTGEEHEPETHLIPLVLRAAMAPAAGPIHIYGDDYDTPDGTCIRDYIHVEDLCAAHLAALNHLNQHPGWHVFNLGTGHGHSVREVIQACQALHQGKPDATVRPRRPGDPARLVASASHAQKTLGWQPQRDLVDCITSASNWHQKQLCAVGQTALSV